MDARNVLTIGIDYRIVRGGVAAVENVYSTFYQPFNHLTTTVTNGQVKKLLVLCKAILQFLYWMLFHPEIKILHVQGASNASFWRKRIFIYIAKWFDKKIVYHMHGGGFGDFSRKHPQAVRRLLEKCDVVIALSDYWKSFFESELHFKNVVVVKNVIAEPVINPNKTTCFSLLFLGLLGQNKGIYDLLDCLNEHKSVFSGKLKLFVGGNGEISKVTQIISKYGLNDIVSFEGWVSGDKKIELLNKVDAYILPSYHEGLPISILEAMSYSLPIISTNVGGIPEILKNGENGFIMSPGDKDAMYRAILELMNNEKLRLDMGKASYSKVQEHMPGFVERQLNDLYRSLLNE